MADRFYAESLEPGDREFVLEGAEVHHLRSVARRRIGDRIALINGRGLTAHGTIQQLDRHTAVIVIDQVEQRPEARGLTMGCALPKGDRAEWLVEKCTELGVQIIIPISTERSIVEPRDSKLDKLRRVAVEACKQCGRPWLMTIEPQQSFASLCVSVPGDGEHTERWLLDPRGEQLSRRSSSMPEIVAVGPEGGFTDAEVDQARSSGWKIISLAGNILRVETAAIAVAAWWELHQAASSS